MRALQLRGFGAPKDVHVSFWKDVANALGMLRQTNRMDAINTMEVWGTGTSNAFTTPHNAT